MTPEAKDVIRHCDEWLKDIFDLAVHAKKEIDGRNGPIDWESMKRAMANIRQRCEGAISQINFNREKLERVIPTVSPIAPLASVQEVELPSPERGPIEEEETDV